MCPSFMVTREEKHSTRGRAHLLWEMLAGDGPIDDGWKRRGRQGGARPLPGVQGLQGRLPRQRRHGDLQGRVPVALLRGAAASAARLRVRLHRRWARLAQRRAGLANLVTQLPGRARAGQARPAGVAQDARIPPFAPETFAAWFARARAAASERPRRSCSGRTRSTTTSTPTPLMAAVEVLEAAGYEVIVPAPALCCGRPLYDFGMLDTARSATSRTCSTALAPAHRRRAPDRRARAELRVGVPRRAAQPDARRDEDAAVLRRADDAARRVPREGARRLHARRSSAARRSCRGTAITRPCSTSTSEGTALDGDGARRRGARLGLLRHGGLVRLRAETRRGRRHACGERALLPRGAAEADETRSSSPTASRAASRSRSTPTGAGLHLAEVLKLALDGGAAASPAEGTRPEAAIRAARHAAVRRSMGRAAVGVLSTASLALALTLGVRAVLRARRGR